jgi:hypothetical protein
MPNYCECAAIITGPDADAMLDTICTQPGLFTALLPIPAALTAITTGACKIDGQIVNQWHDTPDGPRALTTEESNALIDQYGTNSWYDWAIARWGTKWNPEYTREGNTLRFETAWAPPVEFFTTATYAFPNATVELGFAEGGMGYWGTTIIQNGEIISDSTINGEFYTDLPDDAEDLDDYLNPRVRAHLDRYGIGTGG